MKKPPAYDLQGLNVFDPNDILGKKTQYITLLQEMALMQYLPTGHDELALDVGCGYGRLTPLLEKKGWRAFGIDPSKELLDYAKKHHKGPKYCQGQLPDLPVKINEASLILMHNLLRPLKLYNALDVIKGIGKYVSQGGFIVVVDNIRDHHDDYIPEKKIITLIENEGFQLIGQFPLRAARWWVIYAIRYGIIPQKWFKRIAKYELKKMLNITKRPTWQYYNVLFVFKKNL